MEISLIFSQFEQNKFLSSWCSLFQNKTWNDKIKWLQVVQGTILGNII